MRRADLTGQRFGRLVAVRFVGSRKGATQWLFDCDCGTQHIAAANNVTSGNTKSCGCLLREKLVQVVHGAARRGRMTKLYQVWKTMISRCHNENVTSYRWYGQRGISVCSLWRDYLPFEQWALSQGYREGLVIDRLDPDGDYCPENCRWISAEENRRLSRKWGSVTKPKLRKKRTFYQRDQSGRFIAKEQRSVMVSE